MKDKESQFTKSGSIARPRGRQPLMVETGKADRFLNHLEEVDRAALKKIVKRLYDLATTSDNEIVAVRCCEIILAYSLGKPDVIQHNENNQVSITFTRAEPRTDAEPKKLGS